MLPGSHEPEWFLNISCKKRLRVARGTEGVLRRAVLAAALAPECQVQAKDEQRSERSEFSPSVKELSSVGILKTRC